MILKDGSCSLILTTNAINFGLLSEPEQDATIYAYAAFLNSLSFNIQIMIRSIRKDISSYLNLLKKAEAVQNQPLLKEQIVKYRAFVEKIVKENQVLDKKFYIIIPFSAIELGISTGLSQTMRKNKKLPYPIDFILEKAKVGLIPKRDHLISQFARLGLKARQLTDQELLALFYGIYNPDSFGQKLGTVKNYSAPIVTAAISNEAPDNKIQPAEENKTNNFIKPGNQPS